MIPRWHVLTGVIFATLFWFLFPKVSLFYLALIFFSAVLIDVDHYLSYVIKTRDWSLKRALKYYNKMLKIEEEELKRGIKRKSPMMIFHTVEFHIFVFFLGYLWIGFFYIFAGMIFHSLVDFCDGLARGLLHRREYFLIAWLLRKKKD